MVQTQLNEQKDGPFVHKLQWLSHSFSILCLFGLAAWLYHDVHTLPTPRTETIPLIAPEHLKNYLKAYDKRSSKEGWEKPVYVPTGVYIRSVEFTGAYNVRLTGTIWQRYKNSMPADIKHEIFLPEAQKQELKFAYHIQNQDEEIIGWHFVAELRQEFDYLRYPFDRQDVWLRLWHANFARNIVLVPDFASFSSMDPVLTPGVERRFVLEGWDIERSFFSYQEESYNTNFGFQNYAGQKNFPELYFNIGLRRQALAHLIGHGVAPIGILFLIFFVFSRFSRVLRQRELLDLSWSGLVATCSAFFFATLLAQSGLRNTVHSDGFVYLEGLYLLIYPLIVVVCVLATQLLTKPKRLIVQYHDDLIPKLLYWPLVMLSIIGITTLAFH